jgi:branched-chain amino acid transport system substrate-binding protein
MKRTYLHLLWFLVVLMMAGCMARPVERPEEIRLGQPGDELFYTAEQLFRQKKSDEAMGAYAQYLSQFPQGRHADNALRRMGMVYALQGQDDTALTFYQRLLDEFGESPYADEAHLAVIDLLARQNRSEEALHHASQMAARQLDDTIRLPLWQRLVELYAATGDMAGSAIFQYQLYQSTTGREKEAWGERLAETIPKLNSGEVEQVWDQIEEEPFRADLMYQFAVSQAMAEKYDDAADLLTAFMKAYPQHPQSGNALNLAAALFKRLEFTPLAVGCLLPLSGSHSLYGQRALNGIELALSMMQSGPAPAAINLLIKDTASDDARAVQAVRELAEAGVGVILGPMITAPAAAEEAQRLQIPMITFTQKADITAAGDYIFRHFITPQSQVQTLVEYFIKALGLRNFAVMHPDEQYGKTFMTLFWHEVVRQGGRVVGVEAYNANETDFTVTFKKLKGIHHPVPRDLSARSSIQTLRHPNQPPGSDEPSSYFDPLTRLSGLYHQTPAQARDTASMGARSQSTANETIVDFEVLFIPDAPKKAGLIIPQVIYNDIKGVYLAGTNLWHSPQLIEMSKDYLGKAILVDGFFKESQSETVQAFVQMHRDIYGTDPGVIEAFAFDSARLVFTQMADPNLRMRHAFRDALRQSSLQDGVTGPLAFDEKGDAIKHLFLLGIQGNQFIEIPNP